MLGDGLDWARGRQVWRERGRSAEKAAVTQLSIERQNYTRGWKKKSKPWDSNAGLTNYIGPNGVKGWIFKWKERSIKFYCRLCTRKKVEVVDGTRSQALDVCSTIQKCSMTFWRGSRFSGFFWSSLVMRSRAPERTYTTIELKIILRLLGPLVEKTDPTNFRRESDENFVGTKRWGWTDIHTASLERAKIFSRGKPDVKNISD